ncbi:hypothetical protein AJ79_08276 [Helicocarpus griseus UAMH5409]|uniref:Zinc finger H2C2-type histone UAS binding domain-containing protein n=1 Tax=Helicocarpus griseus UAMH5409 TaxID=1447875 RepID=A0A2B7WUT4_9EURO|nr:hypothetical protein AJ79_08276 [Helicocarpus griseus UAMH5409]
MPAVHEDPAAPIIFRTSGQAPFPDPANPQLPPNIYPRQVTLRDRVTVATLVPFSSPADVPRSLKAYLCDQLNKEIEMGDTYPMMHPIPLDSFGPYWFSNFGAVMLLGDISSIHEVQSMERMGTDWRKICLGSFNIKPNYPGRSSHVCNGTFLVTDASRNRGVGRLMGEGYLEWAPLLGYTYSVFNLVYESNVASCRIWDALGFKRIGKVPGCGYLRSYPNQPVDGIIYGRDLGPEGEDFVSEERFDKIRYYLKHSKYPTGADRAEKSRLRSAATHYKLVGGQNGEPEKLMLKDKEVVSDPQQQYEIARQIHLQQHGGINKTTAFIALKYHWVRIKETVSMVIKNCPQCKEAPKAPPANSNINPEVSLPRREKSSSSRERTYNLPTNGFDTPPDQLIADQQFEKDNPFAAAHPQMMHGAVDAMTDYADLPLDPQIMDDIQQHLPPFQHHDGVDPYGQGGLHDPHALQHEFDHASMQHHDHSNDYQVVEDDDGVIASEAMREHTLRMVDTAHQDLLNAAFAGRDDTHFNH